MWNSTLINPPPNLTYEVKGDRIDAVTLTRICCEAVSVLNSQQALHLEAAALSRFLYRTKVKMRFDKGIMYMAQVNRCLLRYLSMDLAGAYNSLMSTDEDGFGIVCAPSRQRLEWVLVRTQGFAQLFCHIMKTCQSAARYMMCRLHLGHVWDLALISLGLAGRIWTISKFLVLQSCEWYEALKPYLNTLQPVGLPWLPADYEFPQDLKSWLQVPLLTPPTKLKPKNRNLQNEIFDLINDDDDEALECDMSLNEDICMKNETNNQSYTEKLIRNTADELKLPQNNLFTQTEDVGEPVLSTSSLPFDQGKKKSRKRKKRNKIEEFSEDVKNEILNETLFSPSTKTEVAQFQEKIQDEMSDSFSEFVSFPSNKRKIMQFDKEVKVGIPEKSVIRKKKKKKNTDMQDESINNSEVGQNTEICPLKKKKIKKVKKFEQKMENELNVETNTSSKQSFIKKIEGFKSMYDLKKFLTKERKRRKVKGQNCITKDMDKLQWHMFERTMEGYVQQLSSHNCVEGGSEYRRILKQAKKDILIRIQ